MEAMDYLSKEDCFEVRLGSMLASYDRDILTTLYQPVIGYAALALYFTLWSETKRNDYCAIRKHEALLKTMGIELSELLKARKALEGIGLLKTFRKKQNRISHYFYELYAPKSPEEFFDDVVFKGVLSEKIGAKEVERISLMLSSPKKDTSAYEEITASFYDVFHLDEKETMRVMNIRTTRGRKTVEIRGNFDSNEFLSELQNTAMISPDAFQAEDLKEIFRIATLFGLSGAWMSFVVARCYHPEREEHLDFKEVFEEARKLKSGVNIHDTSDEKKEYRDEDAFGKKLNEMTQNSPFEYLKLKQNYTNPSPADVKIINLLSDQYGLPGPVINAIVDYTLIRCRDSLPQAYVEKLAATMARKGVTTALAACNALKGGTSRKKKDQDSPTEKTVEEPVSDISVEDLMKELEDL